jgi:molecular chaperone Hsp33
MVRDVFRTRDMRALSGTVGLGQVRYSTAGNAYDEEDLVMVTAQPDADLDWIRGLDEPAIRRLDKDVELGLLEKRRYRFECGCNQDQMLGMLAPVMRNQPDELFQGEEVIRIHCPRCGARHTITRESLEAHLARLD